MIKLRRAILKHRYFTVELIDYNGRLIVSVKDDHGAKLITIREAIEKEIGLISSMLKLMDTNEDLFLNVVARLNNQGIELQTSDEKLFLTARDERGPELR